VLPALATLIVVQDLDTAAETARHRLAGLPALLQQLDRDSSEAAGVVEAAKQQLAANGAARRDLETQASAVEARLSRFEDHKAAVKTNQEFTALLHEIEVARGSKDALDDQILGLLEDADGITAAIAEAEQTLARVKAKGEATRREIEAEKTTIEHELARLGGERSRELAGLEAPLVARYEQILKQRRMLAVARLERDVCSGCHVKLRPVVAQHVRHNDAIVTCDSCQRILYAPAAPATVETSDASPA